MSASRGTSPDPTVVASPSAPIGWDPTAPGALGSPITPDQVMAQVEALRLQQEAIAKGRAELEAANRRLKMMTPNAYFLQQPVVVPNLSGRGEWNLNRRNPDNPFSIAYNVGDVVLYPFRHPWMAGVIVLALIGGWQVPGMIDGMRKYRVVNTETIAPEFRPMLDRQGALRP